MNAKELAEQISLISSAASTIDSAMIAEMDGQDVRVIPVETAESITGVLECVIKLLVRAIPETPISFAVDSENGNGRKGQA